MKTPRLESGEKCDRSHLPMSQQPIYISRQQAETFLAEFDKALNQPSLQPLLFQVHGIGGVGKSTLLRKVQEIYQQQADFSAVSFGLTEGIETPLTLMATLYELLPKPSLPSVWKRDLLNWEPPADPFTSLNEQYQQTLLALQNQSVSGKPSVDGEQQSAVKDLLELGILTLFSATGAASLDTAVAALGKGVGMLKDAPQAIASGKERVLQLLQQHPATKGKKELQELMLQPLPKLTQAFAQGLIQKAQTRPIVLVLDTYEKAPSAIDLWLCQYLLGNTEIKSHNVRIVLAGRHNLLRTEYWRKLQQDRELVYAQSLERFDQEQTADYLQQIGITEPDDVGDIYKATKGLPYYLNWIRREKLAGRAIDFSQGNQAIVELLLQGLNPTQKQVLQLAACCRWFDKGLIRHLMKAQTLNFDTAADDRLNCFEWLTQRDFAEFAQHRYRLIDFEFLERCNFSKAQIEKALETCFRPIASLDGIAKFAALMSKSRRCPENQRLDWLRQAQVQAEQLATPAEPEFSSGLFLWALGYALGNLGRIEEAIASYDKA
ncbi:MAG: hypothetical protein LDL41_13695, partial [Coleofasciculus sp. S288]|nr:hypothetical protein [Coleofasciculus sp. S288]